MGPLKSRVLFVVGLAVGASLLVLALRGTSLTEIMGALSRARPWMALPFLAVYALVFLVKAHRWGVLLGPTRDSRIGELLPATVVGQMSSLLLPAYLGELARAYVLSRQVGVRYAPILATLFVERVLDVLAILLCLGPVLALEPRTPPELATAGRYLFAVGTVLVALTIAAARWPGRTLKLLRVPLALLPSGLRSRILEELQTGLAALAGLRRPSILVRAIASSALFWGLMALCTHLSLLALRIEAPPSAALVVMALTATGMTLPNSPGFFGTIQFCFTLGLAPFGVAKADAFAASVFFHLGTYGFVVVTGLVYLRRLGYGLRRVTREAAAAEARD